MHLNGGQAEFRDVNPTGWMQGHIEVGVHHLRTEVLTRENQLRSRRKNETSERAPFAGEQEYEWNGDQERRLQNKKTEGNSGKPGAPRAQCNVCGCEASQQH